MGMLIMGVLLIFMLVLLGGYLLGSAAITRVLKLFGYETPAFGWVPFVRHYALGTVCIQQTGALPCVVGPFALPNAVLQWGWAAAMAAYLVPAVGYVLGLALSVLYFGTVYRFVYSRLSGGDSAALAAVSAVVRVIFYIKVLAAPRGGNGLHGQPGDVYPKGSAA